MHGIKLENRIEKAWAKFFLNKAELCNKHYNLRDRLRLFQASVTNTVLYGSGSWVMTAGRAQKLRSAQRRMLRWMLNSGRKTLAISEKDEVETDTEVEEPTEELEETLESWTDWIRRTTHTAEYHLLHAGAEDCVEGQRRRKWRWAGHVARRQDRRWSSLMLAWQPEGRKSRLGRPKCRWRDEFDGVFEGGVHDWIALAQ